jgi:hypothetical protein
MSQNSTPRLRRQKCIQCGLVNVGEDEHCRRCGGSLAEARDLQAGALEPAPATKPPGRSLLRRIMWVVSATLIVLVVWYFSLLISSDPLQPEQHLKVDVAIGLLELRGFSHEAFVLRHATQFRSTDNWWNRYIGHRDAYAATNFPFEIVTLYPEFFNTPVDDCERSAVLLHEARHLLGDGEEAALRSTWMAKQRLGWTAERYKQTRVWDATERLTKEEFPYMFQCGPDGQSDCY